MLRRSKDPIIQSRVEQFVKTHTHLAHEYIPKEERADAFDALVGLRWQACKVKIPGWKEEVWIWLPRDGLHQFRPSDLLVKQTDLTAFGVAPYPTENNEFINLAVVSQCIDWLKPRLRLAKSWWTDWPYSSYGFKHVVERAIGTYVTNGALIYAVLQMGYDAIPCGPNALFRFEFAEEGFEKKRRRADFETSVRARASKYGLPVDTIVKMLEVDQCVVCEAVFSDTEQKNIDHDHETGLVRGVVCAACNQMFGGIDRANRLGDAAIDRALEHLRRGRRTHPTPSPMWVDVGACRQPLDSAASSDYLAPQMLSPLAFAALAALIAVLLTSFAIYARNNARIEPRIVAYSQAFSVDDAAKKFEVSPKTVRRFRVLADVESKSCATCAHFDLSKGAEAIKSHGIMLQVTNALSPGAISRDPTNSQSWSEFGACLKRPGLIIGSTDWCGKFKELDEQGDTWA